MAFPWTGKVYKPISIRYTKITMLWVSAIQLSIVIFLSANFPVLLKCIQYQVEPDPKWCMHYSSHAYHPVECQFTHSIEFTSLKTSTESPFSMMDIWPMNCACMDLWNACFTRCQVTSSTECSSLMSIFLLTHCMLKWTSWKPSTSNLWWVSGSIHHALRFYTF